MNTKSIDKQMDLLEKRREAANDRYMDKWEAAEKHIGELCREGKTVFYISLPNVKYREGSRAELIEFLIRNRYV